MKKPRPNSAFPKFSRKTSSPQELKLFRSALAQLKKRGVIDVKIDARSARPYFVRGGKTLAELVNKNSASVQASKLPPSVKPLLTLYKRSAPKSVTKQAPKTPAKLLPANRPIKFRKLPGQSKNNLVDTLSDLESNPQRFNQLKRDDEYFGARLYGSDTYKVFRTVQELERYMERYQFEGTPEDIIQEISLIRWTGTQASWQRERRGLSPEERRKAKAKSAAYAAMRRRGRK